jgi:OHCU decarboxylase
MNLAELNDVSKERFVESIGWIFEHSPWVAERAWERRPFASVAELSTRMNETVTASAMEEKLALLRAHPDLGTRAKISPASTGEQAGAGLDRLTPTEYATLERLNTEYRARFGFPFLFAVKGANKFVILESLAARVAAPPGVELEEALRQVYRIAQFRLEGLLTEE